MYAETHYRFKYFPFSLYYRRQPEIIFDTPYRLEPNQQLPVFLIIKDTHRYPIEIMSVRLTAKSEDQELSFDFTLNEKITSPLWHRTFEIDVSSLQAGMLSIDGRAIVRIKNRNRTVRNDNHPGLSHKPFKVFKAEHPLPCLPGWTAGELHCHSSYGCDQVEFGAPPGIYQRAAEAIGLQWVALTDHSYNLDDLPDDYLTDDPQIRKWQFFQTEVKRLNNSNSSVLLIPGEELTCRSRKGRNVHLLILGNRNFLHGTGDSAQRWLHTRSELSVDEALAAIDSNSVAVAAHPFSKVAVLERLLIRRDIWDLADLANPRLDGWQINNGVWDEGFKAGMKNWINLINQSAVKFPSILAGNDAHGNLNRFRQVKTPMIRLWERNAHLFGRVTTRLRTGQITVSNLLDTIRKGEAVISDGPALELNLQPTDAQQALNLKDQPKRQELSVKYLTTPEFGKIDSLTVFAGQPVTSDQIDQGEKILIELKSSQLTRQPFGGEIRLQLEAAHYIRVHMSTITDSGLTYQCWSNPV